VWMLLCKWCWDKKQKSLLAPMQYLLFCPNHHINFYFNSKKLFPFFNISISILFKYIFFFLFFLAFFFSAFFHLWISLISIIFSSHFAERRTKVKRNFYPLWQRYDDDHETHFFSSYHLLHFSFLHIIKCFSFRKIERKNLTLVSFLLSSHL
jgi:hypothetical protein